MTVDGILKRQSIGDRSASIPMNGTAQPVDKIIQPHLHDKHSFAFAVFLDSETLTLFSGWAKLAAR